jgi:phosphatidylglycerophosphate synthase
MSRSPAKKFGSWFLKSWEAKVVAKIVPTIPKRVQTHHLTYCTILWSLLAVLGGYLAKWNLNYLWITSFAVVAQYTTDLLDGAVGRARNTGLIRWGFYMDHLLDYLFLCSILAGYWFVTPFEYKYVLFMILALSGAYFLSTMLAFGATGRLEIASMGIGPTEIRLLFVIANTMLAVSDKIYFRSLLVPVFLMYCLFLLIHVYKTQKMLWSTDMDKLNKSS